MPVADDITLLSLLVTTCNENTAALVDMYSTSVNMLHQLVPIVEIMSRIQLTAILLWLRVGRHVLIRHTVAWNDHLTIEFMRPVYKNQQHIRWSLSLIVPVWKVASRNTVAYVTSWLRVPYMNLIKSVTSRKCITYRPVAIVERVLPYCESAWYSSYCRIFSILGRNTTC